MGKDDVCLQTGSHPRSYSRVVYLQDDNGHGRAAHPGLGIGRDGMH